MAQISKDCLGRNGAFMDPHVKGHAEVIKLLLEQNEIELNIKGFLMVQWRFHGPQLKGMDQVVEPN